MSSHSGMATFIGPQLLLNHLLSYPAASQSWQGKRRGQRGNPWPSKQPADIHSSQLRAWEEMKIKSSQVWNSPETTCQGGQWDGWPWSSGPLTFSYWFRWTEIQDPAANRVTWSFLGSGAKGPGFISRWPRGNHLFSNVRVSFPSQATHALQALF